MAGRARPCRAGPGCRAARRATGLWPSSRPCGLPSFAQHGRAGDAGVDHEGGPSRGRGSRALVSFAGTRTTAPLDELARCSRTPLRFVCCARARSSPRLPARPRAGPPEAPTAATPGVPAAARPPRQSLPVGQLGGTSAAEPPQWVNGAVTALTWHSRLSRTPSSPRQSTSTSSSCGNSEFGLAALR